MSRNQIIGRVEKLEQRQPTLRYSGVDRFIWNGPEEDAALAEAERVETRPYCGSVRPGSRVLRRLERVSLAAQVRDCRHLQVHWACRGTVARVATATGVGVCPRDRIRRDGCR